MGLDQYAYRRDPEDEGRRKLGIEGVVKKREVFATWRKHPALHGYMEELWELKGKNVGVPETAFGSGFNAQAEVQVTGEDLDRLEDLVRKNHLAMKYRGGFFFGEDCSTEERTKDLAFIKKARAWISKGYSVYYSSWW
jgi:hypothetical protein